MCDNLEASTGRGGGGGLADAGMVEEDNAEVSKEEADKAADADEAAAGAGLDVEQPFNIEQSSPPLEFPTSSNPSTPPISTPSITKMPSQPAKTPSPPVVSNSRSSARHSNYEDSSD